MATPAGQGGWTVESKAGSRRVLIEGRALSLAFQLGQSLERVLLEQAGERATRQAPPAGPVLVSVEDVRASLARLGLDTLLQPRVGVPLDGPLSA
jgi:hypothetical protein